MKEIKFFKKSFALYFSILSFAILAILSFAMAQSDQNPSSNIEHDKQAPESQDNNNSDLKKMTETIDSNQSQTDQTLPVFEKSLDYRYESVGKRDPFRPYRDAKIGIGQVRVATRTPEPLERFDIKVLEVVAIVWDNSKPKALIQDPEKGIHSVVKGQRIGKNDGYIAEIREGEVVVVEMFDLNGKIIKEPFVMCIDKSKGCGT